MKNKEIVELGQKYLMNTYGRFPIAWLRERGVGSGMRMARST